MQQGLNWGRKYLMVAPSAFDVRYAINPYMDPKVAVDHALAMQQWQRLHDAIIDAGGQVQIMAAAPHLPDMVFAMNLAYVGQDGDERRALLSSMRHEERRAETALAREYLRNGGFAVHETPAPLAFEAGDVFPWQGRIWAATGPRTDVSSLKHLEFLTRLPVDVLHTISQHAYHFDLAFCPLTAIAALVYPQALDNESSRRLLQSIPVPIILTEEEATVQFAANSIVVNDTVLMPVRTSSRVQDEIHNLGLTVKTIDVSEFEKAGGSIRCLTNPMDFPLGGNDE